MATSFHVNGAQVATGCDSAAPLLHVLRNELGLTAAKFGCGTGHCGACTVVVNGRAMQSCTAPLWSLQDAQVTTLEGLAGPGGELGEVQRALRDRGAIQCGFCIPGIVMTLHALKLQRQQATLQEIRAELGERNLCRCGTHTRILAAAQEVFACARP